MFDYGTTGCADQMRVTLEKLTHHAGTIYSSDISNELTNREKVTLVEPEYTDEVKAKHANRVTAHRAQERRLKAARLEQMTALEAIKARRTHN